MGPPSLVRDRRNPKVRIWKPVKEIFAKVAEQYGFFTGDLISLAALAAASEPELMAEFLEVAYELPKREAEEVANALVEELIRVDSQYRKLLEEKEAAKVVSCA